MDPEKFTFAKDNCKVNELILIQSDILTELKNCLGCISYYQSSILANMGNLLNPESAREINSSVVAIQRITFKYQELAQQRKIIRERVAYIRSLNLIP